MEMDGTQAADFVKVLHPTLQANGLGGRVHIACCDATGWATQRNMTRDLAAAGAAPLVGVVTSHIYTSKIDRPLATDSKVWQTETADLGGHWSTAWFSAAAAAANNTKLAAGDGLTWARNIHTGLTAGNVSAYLWWVATQDAETNGNNNEKLVLVDSAAGNYTVAKRLWAFAHYSRAARPGAVRLGVGMAAVGGAPLSSGVYATAFRNVDGAVAVVVVNEGAEEVRAVVDVAGTASAKRFAAQAWVTDEARDMASVDGSLAVATDGTVGGVVVPAHGMASVVIRAT